MSVSVICTVRNEEKTIKALIDSLLEGARKPDEIVIVDGGSSDGSIQILESYAKQFPLIKYLIENGANISRGRNIAFKNATSEIIASIDGGCTADIFWLKNLMEPFERDPSIDYVGGFYLPDSGSPFEDVVGDLLYPRLDSIDPEKFIPSVKSMAIKKKCWEAVGGYPEWLYTAEDNIFLVKLAEKRFKYRFVKDAIVYWKPRSNFIGLYKQYYYYTVGAKQANLRNATFRPYGVSFIAYFAPLLVRYMLKLITSLKLIHLLCVPMVLTAVLAGKVIGTINGRKIAQV